MTAEMSPTFVSYAVDILADTNTGLKGPEFAKVTTAYSVQWNVTIPHLTYPFVTVPNKRTALFENLAEAQGRCPRPLADGQNTYSGTSLV